MKEKYIEEKYPRYFEFGTSADGKVDIASTQMDTVATVTKEHAHNLIADRDRVIDALVTLALAFDNAAPQAFNAVWYGVPFPQVPPPGEQDRFEQWGVREGVDLTEAENLTCSDGRFPATYSDPRTETAWRAWANKPRYIPAPVQKDPPS